VSIADLAELVWRHSHSIEFGGSEAWDESLFTAPWGSSQQPKIQWRSYGPGWYWFLSDLTLDELCALERPTTLPLKGRDIGEVARVNLGTFGSELLCKTREDGLLLVYNGHEKSVCDRVRAHFSLKNDKTGALGLRHFVLHSRRWEVRLFSAPCLDDVPESQRSRLAGLMASKSGRSAVESAWRVAHGWPVLCKQ
jgi:hypothetical protein